ncbi:MAG: RHS repeat domain-containing protein [Isosphaeraceae bacterium]
MDFTSSGSLATRYLNGPAGDLATTVLARQSSDGTVPWYLPDQLGTDRDLIDDTGSIIDHVDFSAFGTVLDESNPSNGDRMMGFASLERDTVMGLNLAVERVQDPGTGRWTSQDPMGFAAGDNNLYRYVGNDPGDDLDPNGLAGKKPGRGGWRQGDNADDQFQGIDKAQRKRANWRPQTQGPDANPEWVGEKRPKQSNIHSTDKSKRRKIENDDPCQEDDPGPEGGPAAAPEGGPAAAPEGGPAAAPDGGPAAAPNGGPAAPEGGPGLDPANILEPVILQLVGPTGYATIDGPLLRFYDSVDRFLNPPRVYHYEGDFGWVDQWGYPMYGGPAFQGGSIYVMPGGFAPGVTLPAVQFPPLFVNPSPVLAF